MVLFGFPEVRSCRHFTGRSVEAVGQMTTFSQRHSHQTFTRRDQSREDGKVSRAAREGLHIARPLFRVEIVGLERSLLRQALNLIDKLVATVVASARVTLRILIRQTGALQLHDVPACKILRCNQFNATVLASLLL